MSEQVTTARPAPPSFPAGPGHQWTPVEDSDNLVRPVTQERRCRWTVGPGHRQCGRPAQIELRRGTGKDAQWWGYCLTDGHGYGRWLDKGRVMIWVQRPTSEAPDGTSAART